MTTQPVHSENDDTHMSVVEESSAVSPPTSSTIGDTVPLIPPAQETPGQGTQEQSYETATLTTPAREEVTIAPEASTPDVEAVQPFTAFIEEFRQREERMQAILRETQNEAFAPRAPETSGENGANGEIPFASDLQEGATTVTPGEPVAHEQQSEKDASPLNTPAMPAERPVSPLLRPSTRTRGPRHSGRHREDATTLAARAKAPASVSTEDTTANTTPSTTGESVVSEQANTAPSENPVEQPRPARRYRFDRPAPTTTTQKAPPPAPASIPARVETAQTSESAPVASAAPAQVRQNGTHSAEQAKTASATEPLTAAERETPPSREPRREKREKEHAAPTPSQETAPALTPEASTEVPVEELPPLEYAELQAANSRRRRRRRPGNGSSTLPATAKAATPEAPGVPTTTTTQPAARPASLPTTPAATPPASTPPAAPYTLVSGYTLSQMNQGSEASGPFMGPEPSPARGSIMSATPRSVRAGRNGNLGEAQRAAGVGQTYPPVRTGEGGISHGAIHQLTNAIVSAIQTQSDRLAAELRQVTQGPTSVSVSLPPFPSNERVGVFVDVANLLYSARTQRLTVDFAKLLDFLRGNRRLVRAHAYAPTSPQPGDDQMFLQAVKGLGYRITTKHYKTFSSGAKKADLDLDLCMDVVRLVDAKAVDCIVLVSGDSDFMPMLDYCSDHGVRVEVAAFDESMSATLRQSCDLFINLSLLDAVHQP